MPTGEACLPGGTVWPDLLTTQREGHKASPVMVNVVVLVGTISASRYDVPSRAMTELILEGSPQLSSAQRSVTIPLMSKLWKIPSGVMSQVLSYGPRM